MNAYKEQIQQIYPELAIHDIQINQAGQNNIVLIINDAIVFRFPRYEAGRKQLQIEQHILSLLKNHLPLPIPNPHYLNLSAPIHQAFIGYPKIEGEIINIYTLEQTFDDETCDKLAGQLASFLLALHTASTDTLRSILPATDDYSYWHQVYKQVQVSLYPYMRADAREQITDHFERFFQNTQKTFVPTLIHGDFGTGNILFDRKTQSFSGVIDFGSCSISDPAIDLAALYGFEGRGEQFFNRMLRYYPNLDAMLPRIQFYSGTFALLEALHGVHHNDDDALKAGLESYV